MSSVTGSVCRELQQELLPELSPDCLVPGDPSEISGFPVELCTSRPSSEYILGSFPSLPGSDPKIPARDQNDSFVTLFS